MLTLSHLYIYPIKSLGGISVSEAVVEEKGFRHDRRFMLVTPSGDFMTQRTNHHMALIDVAIDPDQTLRVWHRHRPDNVLVLPLTVSPDAADEALSVSIWDDENVPASLVSLEADRWFSDALGKPCRLVFMPDSTRRPVDPAYDHPDAQGRPSAVSFADGYPYLLIGQASLNDLNQRLPQPIAMARFRPNVVVSGSLPYDEDAWQQFRIGDMNFYGVKPCARCVLTTIDPATGQKGQEPLHTLAQYRRWKHKILFGQNVLADANTNGRLRVGQAVEIISRVEPWLVPSAIETH
ncbi:MOSC domain-containing protein [Spirosoma arcticum]